jgi:hypothetical protein
MKTLLAILFTLVAAPLAAQTVVPNPKTVEFAASPDHTTLVGTVPMLDHYELVVVQQNNLGAIVFTQSLGKPTPGAGNVIGPIAVAQFLTMPSNVTSVGFIDAMPSAGLGLQPQRSVASDPFVRLDLRPAGKPVVKQ